MFEKIKQLKDLRERAQQMKTMLAQEKVQGEGGSGKVRIAMDGNQEVLAVEISPELLNPSEKETVEKYIKEAVNDALNKVRRVMAEKMQSTGGLGMFGM
ncbi:MAG: YbaB/EbfC family nucleoid-associated protein [Patescibacteria group bacterium]|nr:YbaB/EbfC family nucleoid-associated protein [Patescibacteria group bacterium]MDD5715348.1 YbaB/EbfC family nucleoid-associated protein [Patescibacteria group bacterium]